MSPALTALAVRSLALIAAAGLAAAAQAGVTVSFVLPDSFIDTDVTDSSGLVDGSGAFNAGGVLFATGQLEESVSPTGFRFAGTTTGGVDDPTRGSSMSFGGVLAESDAVQLDLAADLRLVNNGSGSLVSTLVFEIFSDSTDPLAYEISSTGSAFGNLTPITGTIFGDGTLTAGTYSLFVSMTFAAESTWSLRVVPAPGAATLALASLALIARRRRR